jgi:hypothetical protein
MTFSRMLLAVAATAMIFSAACGNLGIPPPVQLKVVSTVPASNQLAVDVTTPATVNMSVNVKRDLSKLVVENVTGAQAIPVSVEFLDSAANQLVFAPVAANWASATKYRISVLKGQMSADGDCILLATYEFEFTTN